MKPHKLIEIRLLPTGNIETVFWPKTGISTVHFGMALASAARVLAESLVKELKLPREEHYQPVLE